MNTKRFFCQLHDTDEPYTEEQLERGLDECQHEINQSLALHGHEPCGDWPIKIDGTGLIIGSVFYQEERPSLDGVLVSWSAQVVYGLVFIPYPEGR